MGIDDASELPEPENGGAGRVPLDFRIGITLMVVVLSAAVVVLALTGSGGTKTEVKPTIVTTVADTALRRAVAALGARVAAGDRSRAAVQKSVAALHAEVAGLAKRLAQGPRTSAGLPQLEAQLRTLGTELRTANQCLFQVQKQLDDLQTYALTRAALHKRVSGACLHVLQPRYAGK